MLLGQKPIESDNEFQFGELLYYVEDMMQTRQLELRQKSSTHVQGDKPDYKWLSSVREEPAKLDTEQLVKIRQLAVKMTAAECSAAICQANNILNTTGKSMLVEDIPSLIIQLLDRKQVCSLLTSVHQKRGPILRRTQSNRLASEGQPRPSVTFNPEPSYIIFSIYND